MTFPEDLSIKSFDLLFEKLVFREALHPALRDSELGKEGCLVATYQALGIAEALSEGSLELLRNCALDASVKSSSEHGGCSVTMPDFLPESVDVCLVPVSRVLRHTKLLRLELLGSKNRIVGTCSEDDYNHFSSESQRTLIVAGQFRHRLRISLGQETMRAKPLGVSIPINRISVSVEPVNLEDFDKASRILQLASRENASKIFGAEVSKREPPKDSADRRKRVSRVVSLITGP